MDSMIDDLLNPDFLPDKTERVSLVQTHISLVFVADEFVYKVKKPVDFGFLDFLTLEKRRYYCQQEVMLNRRLSKGVYIDVLPIVYDGKNYRIGVGEGKIAEYAVKMKRLPDDMLMKTVFLRGELEEKHLKKIANILTEFHITSQNTKEIDEFGKPEMFKINTDENFAQTKKYIGKTIQKKEFDELKRWTSSFYASNGKLFYKRIKGKKIRDCHGDLHMEHVCLTEDISIFDCIEFNDRFRYTDVIADIAFLLMDLEYYEGYAYSKLLWDFYKALANESGAEDLLNFYKVYRAYVRGKVTSFQLDDPNIGIEKKENALQSATKYFHLARSYIG